MFKSIDGRKESGQKANEKEEPHFWWSKNNKSVEMNTLRSLNVKIASRNKRLSFKY